MFPTTTRQKLYTFSTLRHHHRGLTLNVFLRLWFSLPTTAFLVSVFNKYTEFVVSGMEFFKAVQELFKPPKVKIEPTLFKIQCRFAAINFVVIFAVFQSIQILGTPSQCFTEGDDKLLNEKLATEYCWERMFIVGNLTKKEWTYPFPQSLVTPTVGQTKMYVTAPRFVPLFFLVLALMFLGVHRIWCALEGNKAKNKLEFQGRASKKGEFRDSDEWKERRNKIVKKLTFRFFNSRVYGLSFLFCQFLLLGATVLSCNLFDNFIGFPEFTPFFFGWKKWPFEGTPGGWAFPPSAKCTFNYRTFATSSYVGRNPHCVIYHSVFYRMVFAYIWMYLRALLAVGSYSITFTVCQIFSPRLRLALFNQFIPEDSPESIKNLERNGSFGSHLLLYIVGINMDDSEFSELLGALDKRLQMNRSYKND